MSRLSANALLLLTAAIWGGGFVAQSNAMASLGSFWFTGLRFVLAFVAVLPFGLRESRRAARPLSRGDVGQMVVLGITFYLGTVIQQFAISLGTVTHVGFLTGLYVLFVPLLELVIFRRMPHPVIWPGAAIAVAGTWFLGGGLDSLTASDLLTIVSALFFAVQIILMDRIARRTERPVAAALTQSAVAVVLGCGCGLLWEPLDVSALPSVAPELLYAGALSGGVAFALQAVGQQYTRAADAAVMMMSEALFAALFGAILLGERLNAGGWIGCGCIMASLLLVQLVPLVWPGRAAAARAA
ncbi:DMT family transporter [Segnochrobactrum spirostomi]|uniref:DMT family transporter n=1 Tax=Segnochrobactrum spirostomi TaxID=2608987 RepID=A0A6A7XYF0_9HYPH|nr:DMT family transporter [Segnochrobactrum spirostomi]MQT11306.1 DMT family transporter [Segnochrobactrum spirostomi]